MEIESNNPRAKLYILSNEGAWLEQGVGFPTIEGRNLVFRKHTSNEEIYTIMVQPSLDLEQQEDKIIVWYDEAHDNNMAMSFQDNNGAEDTWKRMNDAMNQNNTFGPTRPEYRGIQADEETGAYFNPSYLEVPTIDNLVEFEKEIYSLTSNMEKIAEFNGSFISHKFYLIKLTRVLKELESSSKEADGNSKELNAPKQEALFRIFRQIISVGNFELLCMLMNDDYYDAVFGALEYDPKAKNMKKSHREFFAHVKARKLPIVIKDEEITHQIDLNIRLLYLRDCTLAHYFDEHLITTIIHSNYLDILKYIQTSKEMILSIIGLTRTDRIAALKYIREICTIVKVLDTEKEAVYRVFNEYCLYDQIEDIVKNVKSNPPAIGNKLHKNNTTKSKDQTQDNESVSADFQEAFRLCLEIMQYSLQHAPQYLRQHLISHRQKVLKYPFLTFLVECIFQHQTEKMNLTLLSEIFKLFLEKKEDTEEENEVQGVFFTILITQLQKALEAGNITTKDTHILLTTVEFLSYSVKNVWTKVKPRLLDTQFLNVIFSKLLESQEKHVLHSGISLFKALVQTKEEEEYPKLLPAFEKIERVIREDFKYRNNLIVSAFLEIIQFFINEEVEVFLRYITDKNIFGGIYKPWLEGLQKLIQEKMKILNSPNYVRRQQSVVNESNPLFHNENHGNQNLSMGLMYDLAETAPTKDLTGEPITHLSSNGPSSPIKSTFTNISSTEQTHDHEVNDPFTKKVKLDENGQYLSNPVNDYEKKSK